MKKAVELKHEGQLAGIFPDLTYNQRNIRLEPGDALLLYTDGLADARHNGLVLGSSGIASLLTEKIGKEPEQIIDEIYYYAVDFAGGNLHDDAAAILILSSTDKKA
jgi:sigma-B regulation protein RsbU (phosphoserine phosphatase)